MRTACLFFFSLISIYCNAQKIVKYYDNDWAEVSRDKAIYYAEFIKQGSIYRTTSYWIATNTVRGRSTFPDTTMANPDGLQLLYNKKGKIEDSIYFEDGKSKFVYHYYPNGKLAVHYYLPENKTEGISEGWDEDGNKIKNFIYSKDASFKGGQKGWEAYLKKSIGKDFSITNDTITSATVQVQFTIDENGSVIKSKIFKSSGNKEIDRNALDIISESPEWNNAILYNQPVKVYRLQSITYILKPDKKSSK